MFFAGFTGVNGEGNVSSTAKQFSWKWIVAALALLALIIAGKFFPIAEWLKQFSDWIKTLGLLGILLYAGVYAVATVCFLPGWIFTVAAGVSFGLFWGTIAAVTGATIGAALAFLIARYLARDAISRRFAGSRKFKQLDDAIGREGWKMIGLLRLSPLVPFNVSNYLYGLTAVRFVPYVLASFFGMLPGTLLYVYLGTIGKVGLEASKGSDAHRSQLEYIFLVIGLTATIAVTVFVAGVAKRALKEKTE